MPTNKAASVKVEGLTELRNALKRLEDLESIDQVTDALWAAADAIVSEAQGRASSPMERGMASRLKKSRSKAKAAVIIGGKPYDLGAEFGAKRWPQFKEWRGNDLNAGYVLFPAIRSKQDDLVDDLADVIKRVFKDNRQARGSAGKVLDALNQALGG